MPPATIAAAVDVGSNSIHLLVAAIDADALRILVDESVQLGLGDVVDREGHLPAASRDAVVAAIARYAATATRFRATTLTLLATEPLRRASNRSVIQADVLKATGQPLQILSNAAEAQLTLLGVTGGNAPGVPLLVVDVGGGSTELIFTSPGRQPAVGALPTGSARMSATFISHDPPSWFEINALRAEAIRLVEALPMAAAGLRPQRAVGVGGSATNLARLAAWPESAGGLDRAALERIFSTLAAHDTRGLSLRYAVSLRRAQQLVAGAALLDAVLSQYRVDRMEVSTASLREGAVLAAQHGPDWLQRLGALIG